MNLSWKQWLTAGALGLSALAAHAGNVQWSIGINLPPVSTVISGGPDYPYHGSAYPGYSGYPVAPYYAPPAVVYRPAPIYYAPPRAVYRPAPIYYSPPRSVYRPPHGYHRPPAVVSDHRWAPPRWHRDGRWDQHRSEQRGEYRGPRGGRGDDRGDRRQRPGRD